MTTKNLGNFISEENAKKLAKLWKKTDDLLGDAVEKKKYSYNALLRRMAQQEAMLLILNLNGYMVEFATGRLYIMEPKKYVT